ncbi:GDSL-type esterase/lipase family protein [Clavibacter sp. VKM Ac-2872]|uniref:GDSL-type esterase/lipase family protein n=1 Tax=Clavibacter sp. VKM Ac-2872 TaxID=2783812 RepID=UPI00188B446C|nr:GDSL-type esterase/lipase family protein [Clavibacter sp. VKM Ac-2872]MBF4625559.1 hypothetical protein [Clavibacter sp. VKM Ac-2872]
MDVVTLGMAAADAAKKYQPLSGAVSKADAFGPYPSLSARFAALGSDGAFATVPAFNVTLDTSSRLRKALGRVRSKTGIARVLEIGDSTSWGLGAGGADGFPPLKVMSDDFQRSFIDTSYGYIGIEGDNAPVTGAQVDGRTTHKGEAAGWGYSSFGLFNALQHAGTAESAPWILRPDINCDTFDFYYMANSGLGTVDVYVDDVLATSVVMGSGSQRWAKATITFAAGAAHVIKLVKRVNTVFLFGFNFFLSTRPSVQMFNAGVCSSKAYSASGASWGVTGTTTAIDGIPFIAPDLTVIRLGVNDAQLSPYSTTAEWEAALRRIIAAAKVTGDVLLESPVPSDPSLNSGATVTREQGYRDRLLAIAIDTGSMYYDVFGRYGSWTAAQAAGYMADQLHLTAAGGADLATGRGKVVRG